MIPQRNISLISNALNQLRTELAHCVSLRSVPQENPKR